MAKIFTALNNIDLPLLREFLLEYLSEYEDVISPKEASDITGYSLNMEKVKIYCEAQGVC
jgi:hypothetical protein